MIKRKLKKRAFIEALEKSLGVITPALKAANITRQTYHNWLNADPDFKAEVQAVPDIALDFAEAQLYKQMKNGNTAATIFYLKTKGKKRGYTEGPSEEERNKDLFHALPLEKRLEMIKLLTGK